MASIEHRTTGSGEVWRVRFRHERQNRAVTFTDPDRAEKWRRLVEVNPAQALAALDAHDGEPPLTVADQVALHITSLTGVSDGTRGDYLAYLEQDIRAHPLGAHPLTSVDRTAVAAWVNWMEKRGLAGKTIANRHGLLSAAMSSAVRDRLIPDNPCRGVRLPRTSHLKEEMVFLDKGEFERLYGLVHERYRPLVLFLVGTGVRFGEATALRVEDVDVDARSVRIRRAWKRTRRSVKELGPTKSRRSHRTVAVPGQVVESLRPLLAGRVPHDLVFTNARGSEVKQATFWVRVWQPAVCAFAGDQIVFDRDKAGRKVLRVVKEGPGKHPRVHDLRHTFASWAIQNRVPLPVIQRQLGHESITTTIDTYGHLARADFDALADVTATQLPALLGAAG